MRTKVLQRLGLRATVAAFVLAATAVGCGRTPVEVRSRDLVTGLGLRVDGQALRPREVLAADETWVAVTLPAGRPATARLELAANAVLVLAGNLDCGGGPPAKAVLRGGLQPDRGRPVEFAIELAEAAGWWRREIELGRLDGRGAELRIEAEVPPECQLRLREASVRDERTAAPQREGPRVQLLLVSVDTLRRDSVDPLTTPNLHRLAAESERFDACYAAASWTKPSHASMLTGFHPDTHRALLVNHSIDPALPTLASRMQAGGLATGALVYDCTWLSPRWGFGKGFDDYRVTRWRAGAQASAAAEWIFEHRDRDFFFFLHTFEPHADFNILPYEAPGLSRASIGERFGVEGFGCRDELCAAQFLAGLSRGEVPAGPRDGEILRSSYDAGVGYLDRSLGALFERLRAGGLWDELMVVVTSDHGEEFTEHGGYGHETLHEEILRVPLLVKWPRGQRAATVNLTPCSGIDLAPTLLTSAGLPLDDLPGVDLRERSSGAVIMAGTLERAIVADGLKGFFDGKSPDRLFDLRADPGETTDLAGERPGELQRLAGLLDRERRAALTLYRRLGSAHAQDGVELGEAERERLRAFGYLR